MKGADRAPERPVTVIPANVYRPEPGDTVETWQERHRAFFQSVDYGRGVQLVTPEGELFPSSAVEVIRHRRGVRMSWR